MKLFDYQEDGVDFLRSTKRAILCDDPGLGKTPQSILAAQGHKRILVAVPSNLRTQWAEKIEAWTGEEAVVLKTPKDTFLVDNNTRWVVVNHDSMKVHKVDKTTGQKVPWEDSGKVVPSIEIGKTVFGFRPTCVIVDEAHLMVNPKHSWTRGLKYLTKQAEMVQLLTGTPFANEVLDLWTLLNIVQPDEFSSKWKFLKEHANARPGMWGWEYTKYATDPVKLGRLMRKYAMRRTSDILRDKGLMPPHPTVTDLYFDPTDEQSSFFDSISKDGIAEMSEEYIIAPSKIVQLTRMRQASVDMRLVGGVTGSKIDAMVDIVKSSDQRVVVFSCFAEAIDLASEALSGVKHVVYTGSTPERVRDDRVAAFQDPFSGVKAFLATVESGGPGLDLYRGSKVVFLDRHYSPVKNQQAVARCDRYGQTKQVSVVNLRTSNYIDEHVYDIITEKEKNAKTVLQTIEKKII